MTEDNFPDKNKFADVPVRVRSWGIIILIFIVALLHPALTALLVCFLLFQGIREFYKMILPHERIATLGVLFYTISVAHLYLIRELNYPLLNLNGAYLLILLVVLTELNDVFQYLVGKTLGKRKITPTISPNKTVEGFLGGVVLTTLLAIPAGSYLLPEKGWITYAGMGILIAVLGFCGDTFMSYIKRAVGIKDTGNLIPGHGGLLDRMDSLLFITPVYYWSIFLMYVE